MALLTNYNFYWETDQYSTKKREVFSLVKGLKYLSIASLSLLLCISFVSSAFAYTYNGYKWSNVSKLNSCYGDDLKNKTNSDDTYISIASGAFSSWSTALNNKITFTDNSTGSCHFRLQAGFYGNTGWNAQTTYVHVSGSNYLSQASIQFNRTAMDNFDYANNRGVAAHEIGHGLGLSHVTDIYQIMCTYGDGRIVTTPKNDDIAGVKKLYGF